MTTEKRVTRRQAKQQRDESKEEIEAKKFLDEKLLKKLEKSKRKLKKKLEEELERISSKQMAMRKSKQICVIEIRKSKIDSESSDDYGKQEKQISKPKFKGLEHSGSDNEIIAKLPLVDSDTEIADC